MHPVQATEAITCAERQHRELLAHSEREHLARALHQWATPSIATIGQVAHPMRLVAVVVLLMAVLAVAGV